MLWYHVKDYFVWKRVHKKTECTVRKYESSVKHEKHRDGEGETHTKRERERERAQNTKNLDSNNSLSQRAPFIQALSIRLTQVLTILDCSWMRWLHKLPKLFLMRNTTLMASRFTNHYGHVVRMVLRTQFMHWVMHPFTHPMLSLSLNIAEVGHKLCWLPKIVNHVESDYSRLT